MPGPRPVLLRGHDGATHHLRRNGGHQRGRGTPLAVDDTYSLLHDHTLTVGATVGVLPERHGEFADCGGWHFWPAGRECHPQQRWLFRVHSCHGGSGFGYLVYGASDGTNASRRR